MIVPDNISYIATASVIERSMINRDIDYLMARVSGQGQRCELLVHIYNVWCSLQNRIKNDYIENNHEKLTMDFLALQRVEGALTMLLAVLEMNPPDLNDEQSSLTTVEG